MSTAKTGRDRRVAASSRRAAVRKAEGEGGRARLAVVCPPLPAAQSPPPPWARDSCVRASSSALRKSATEILLLSRLSRVSLRPHHVPQLNQTVARRLASRTEEGDITSGVERQVSLEFAWLSLVAFLVLILGFHPDSSTSRAHQHGVHIHICDVCTKGGVKK